jgi:preprotein translocase subunit SecE
MNTSTNEQSGKILNYIAWIGITVITLIAFVCTYYFKFSIPIQSIVWLGWFISSLFLFYCTEQGKHAYSFAKESKIEMQKVVWPNRHETVQTTMIVMAMVAVTGFVLWAVDISMMWIIGKITHLG